MQAFASQSFRDAAGSSHLDLQGVETQAKMTTPQGKYTKVPSRARAMSILLLRLPIAQCLDQPAS